MRGLEPPRVAPLEPKSSASTNSATSAKLKMGRGERAAAPRKRRSITENPALSSALETFFEPHDVMIGVKFVSNLAQSRNMDKAKGPVERHRGIVRRDN